MGYSYNIAKFVTNRSPERFSFLLNGMNRERQVYQSAYMPLSQNEANAACFAIGAAIVHSATLATPDIAVFSCLAKRAENMLNLT